MAVVVGFHCDVISCEACGVARPRPAAAAESSACGRGNEVGLTSVLDRRQLSSIVSVRLVQISLGCMLIDIGKFFFIFFLVITSFACGLNQLYYYYSSTSAGVGSDAASAAAAAATALADNLTTVATTAGVRLAAEDSNFENAFDP